VEVHEVKDAAVIFLDHQIQTGFEGEPSRLYGWSGAERSGGIHLSNILQDLNTRLNKPKHSKSGGNDNPEAIWSMGLAWEHILSWGWSQVFPDHPERIVHLGEFEKDGIVLTPDRVDTMWPGIIEMKATWKSAKKWPITEQWYWLSQGKAYCYALGFDQCRYYVLHLMDVMGMYGGDPIPPKVWEVSWTQGELQRNWDMILQHRDNLVK